MEENSVGPEVDPVRSLSRAVGILRILAGPRAHGLALTEIAKKSGLPHPTVLRLLRHMLKSGLVHTWDDKKSYTLGPLAFELGLAAAAHFDIRELCRASMLRIATQFRDTVYVVQRSGYDAVCIGRVEGESSARIVTIQPGTRRPLGVGAGGLAILMALSDSEVQEIVQKVSPRLSDFLNLYSEDLFEWVRMSRKNGFALSRNRVTAGVTAIGVPIYNGMGLPFAAISIASTHERMPPERQSEITLSLRKESENITAQMTLI